MNVLKDIIEIAIVEDIVEDIEGVNNVRNVRPKGFDTPIRLSKGGIKKVTGFDGQLASLTLDVIFLDFTHARTFLPPIVLAKSKKREKGNKFSFLGFFAVRASNLNEIKKSFHVYMKQSWTGTDFTPEFLLDYSGAQANFLDPFVLFQVSFELQFTNAPKSITTYIWNQDPEGSRGTETAVQEDDD